jgi:hypothetical protein
MEVALSDNQQKVNPWERRDERGICEYQQSAHGTPQDSLQPEDRVNITSQTPLGRTRRGQRHALTGVELDEASLTRHT